MLLRTGQCRGGGAASLSTAFYDEKTASFEDDGGLYDQKDAAGAIKLQALRLRTVGANRGL